MANKFSPGFCSLLFVIPKKNGKLRLVIRLRLLNRHFAKEKFQMETPANLLLSIQKGDWAITVDLSYLHLPMHSSSRKFLHFCDQDEVLQFPILPFGLSVSPTAFARVADTMMAHVRSLGLQIHHYIDDWLLRNHQVEHLRSKPPLLIFTCLICQVSPNRSIVSVLFHWPKPQLVTDF